jgi:hypothetical protein
MCGNVTQSTSLGDVALQIVHHPTRAGPWVCPGHTLAPALPPPEPGPAREAGAAGERHSSAGGRRIRRARLTGDYDGVLDAFGSR